MKSGIWGIFIQGSGIYEEQSVLCLDASGNTGVYLYCIMR